MVGVAAAVPLEEEAEIPALEVTAARSVELCGRKVGHSGPCPPSLASDKIQVKIAAPTWPLIGRVIFKEECIAGVCLGSLHSDTDSVGFHF